MLLERPAQSTPPWREHRIMRAFVRTETRGDRSAREPTDASRSALLRTEPRRTEPPARAASGTARSYCSRQRRANCQRVNASAIILPKAPRQNETTSTTASSTSARPVNSEGLRTKTPKTPKIEREKHDSRGREAAAALLQAVERVLRVGERVIVERGDFEL